MTFFKKIFSNELKNIKKYSLINKKVQEQKNKIINFSNKELELSFKKIKLNPYRDNNISESDLVKLLSICSIVSKRILNLEPFDVQLMGIQAILEGKIIEMKTGEGKTLTAGIAAIIGSIYNQNSYVITVNDYLSKRDKAFLEPLCNFFNLSISYVSKDSSYSEKKSLYSADIIYSTNSTLAFDYLKENLIYNKNDSFLNKFGLVIIDEIDSILIDEARTPLIISSESSFQKDFYLKSFNTAQKLNKEIDYKVEVENKNIILTEVGINKIEKELGIDKLYVHQNINWAHQILQSLQSLHFFKNEMDYIIDNGEIKIIDEFNGRISEGRRWSNGLHQAIEVKENVDIKEDSTTLAEITYQSFFKLFKCLSGMSGTVKEEENEFFTIYGKDVITIPTNKPVIRIDNDDILFYSTNDKYDFIIRRIKEIHSEKRPILVGTISIEQSMEISKLLSNHNLKHEVLNAKNHSKEALIIQNAGQLGAITIATNMAGRGVDIKLSDEVIELGGLFVFGFERYQNRRIDNQLIGRAGRQGEPGETSFLLSLEDHILSMSKNPLYDTLKKQLQNEKDGTKFGMLTRVIKSQQQKISNSNMEYRKNLYKYDQVISTNRNFIYNMRKDLLSYENNTENKSIFYEKIKSYIDDSLFKSIENMNSQYTIEEIALNDFGISVPAVSSIEDLIKNIKTNIFNKFDNLETILLQQIFVETLDKNWRNFLSNIDNLKQGIHLRSYNQKDPIVEFQTDAQILFSKLIPIIKVDIIKTLCIYQPQDNLDNDDNEPNNILESEIISTLESNTSEIESFINSLITQDVDFKTMSSNYAHELLSDLVDSDFIDNLEQNISLLLEFNISKDSILALKSYKKPEIFVRNLHNIIMSKIEKNISEISNNNKHNILELYKDIFVSSVENNHNSYVNNLKDILTQNNYDTDKMLYEINNQFFMVYLNTKFDIILALTNINELLAKKEN